jgi:hypothetical protein
LYAYFAFSYNFNIIIAPLIILKREKFVASLITD